MQNTDQFRIKIINIFDDGYIDFSGYHIANLSFYVNNKLFNHNDYIDPKNNKILRRIITSGSGIKGNKRTQILSELSLKLHISEDISEKILFVVFEKTDIFIEKTPEIRQKFPSLIDLSQSAISWGFSMLSLNPFHAMKISSRGLESHIFSKSIQYVISQLELYAQEGEVHEYYHYWRIQDLCRFDYHMYFERHPHLHGWVLYWRSNEPGKYDSRHVSTLRDLEHEILKRKSLSAEDI